MQVNSANSVDSCGLLCLADYQPQETRWLWPGRIPYGSITILDGDPGQNKSTLVYELAARVTAGRPMFGASGPATAGTVILLQAEDTLDTMHRNLEATGADLGKVLAFDPWRSSAGPSMLLPNDAGQIEALVRERQVRLLVFDPVTSFLAVNPNSDRAVRAALQPVTSMAARQGVAVVLVRHLTKATRENPLYRGAGSIAMIGAARSGLFLSADPFDPDLRVLAQSKSNLGPLSTSLSFRPVEKDGGLAIEWIAESDYSARDLLQKNGAELGSAVEEAKQILRLVLSEGELPAKQAITMASQAGVARRTLSRAKKSLGVTIRRSGFGPGSQLFWSLGGDRDAVEQSLHDDGDGEVVEGEHRNASPQATRCDVPTAGETSPSSSEMPASASEDGTGEVGGSPLPEAAAVVRPDDCSTAGLVSAVELPIYTCGLEDGIRRADKFAEKGLAEFAINVGLKCGHDCAYCSSGSVLFRQEAFKAAGRSPHARGYAMVDPEMPDKVAKDAARKRKRGLVQLCTTVDAWCPAAQEYDLGRRCLEAILAEPGWTVRVLTKNAAVVEDFDLIQKYKDRVLVGLSLTAPADKSDVMQVVEPNASPITARMAAMEEAHRRGLRTYGMLCPLVPGIAAEPGPLDELIRFVKGCGAEEVFAEAVNRRGAGVKRTEEDLRTVGFVAEADAVARIRRQANWSGYARQLVTDIQRATQRHGMLEKLHLLLYGESLLSDDRRRVEADDTGVVWLRSDKGKTTK